MEEMLLDHGRLALECGHLFHRACVLDWMETAKLCPVCRTPIVVSG